MKLTYHKEKNFGDALNPFIFKRILSDFFDDDPKDIFLGIGSILGLKKPDSNVENVIVYSSGFGGNDERTYGSKPSENILKKYDFRCVRGPLTAKTFNLPLKYSVCDGAILIPELITKSVNTPKKYNYAYMPHVGTLKYFKGWKDLISSLGIRFIDPTSDVSFVINEIRSSKILFAEAMHGAIVADSLRVPWLPVKSKKTINEFKWKDFCYSLNLEYKPLCISTLYDHAFLKSIIANKVNKFKLKHEYLTNKLTKGYMLYQNLYLEK